MTKKKWLDNLIFVAAIAAALVALWSLAALAVGNEFVLPNVSDVCRELGILLAEPNFYASVGVTVGRALVAFALSLVLALALALAAHLFPIKRPLDAIVTLLRALPTMSIIFLCIVLFPSKVIGVLVSVLVAFPVLYAAFDSALAELAPLDDMCAVFDVCRLDKVRYVYLPYLPKHTYTQCSSTVALAVKVCIAGEALALPRSGIGVEMYVAKVNLDTAALLAWTIAALVCCYVIDGLFALSKGICRKIADKRDRADNEQSQIDDCVHGIASQTTDLPEGACGSADIIERDDSADNNVVVAPIVLSDVGVAFGDKVLYEHLDITFAANKLHVILGKSGCGKTTLLNVVAGLLSHSGEVSGAKRCSYVFQEPRLAETTVSDNLQLVLKRRCPDGKLRAMRTNDLLRLAGLDGTANRRTVTLSGGEAQRVSLARAFACDGVLLADEPMKSLDLAVKRKLYATLERLLTARPRTVLYVTHDVEEAVMLADEVYVASGSPCNLQHVATLDTPRDCRDPWSSQSVALRKMLEDLV